MLKHILSGGFIYLMIVNAFPWMNAVIASFSRIGAAISGLPNLSPQTVLQLGGQMADTIFSTPASTSVINNLEVAIIQSFCGFVVLLAFTITAIALLFTLVEAYIAISGGIILLGFAGSRFTASASEGYFPFVIRVGIRLLFLFGARCWGSARESMGRGHRRRLQTSDHGRADDKQLFRAAFEDHDNCLFGVHSDFCNAQLRRSRPCLRSNDYRNSAHG